MRMLDLCSGLGGASQAMVDRGWNVTRVDIDPKFKPDVVADIRSLPIQGDFDLIWASPPCTEFSRTTQPWHKDFHKPDPDMSLYMACKTVIQDLDPRYWIIENVWGAQRYFGAAIKRIGGRSKSFYLWGDFPIFEVRGHFCKTIKGTCRTCGKVSTGDSTEWAKIPYRLSYAIARSIE